MAKDTKKLRVTNTVNIRSLVTAAVRREIARTAEHKWFNYTQGTTNAAVAGIVYGLTQPIVQGSDVNQRIGDEVNLQWIKIKLVSYLPTLGVTATLRILVVIDQRNNGSVPAVTDILSSATVTSPMNLVAQSSSRYLVLFDRSYSMVVGGSDQVLNKTLVLKARKVVGYNATTNVAAANGENAVFLVALTDNGTNGPNYQWNAVMHYTDG